MVYAGILARLLGFAFRGPMQAGLRTDPIKVGNGRSAEVRQTAPSASAAVAAKKVLRRSVGLIACRWAVENFTRRAFGSTADGPYPRPCELHHQGHRL
jgi:hypothetical protein